MGSLTKRVVLGLLGLGGIGVCIGLVSAGPLDPPGGPVASTGKTLTEVEPRVAVNPVNTPGSSSSLYRISLPGSYYLTGNVPVPFGRAVGIEIASSDVTLDLNGFTITGSSFCVYAIGVDRVRIRDGTVTASTSHGITAPGLMAEVNGVNAASCGGNGIDVGASARVIGCVSRGNGAHGIRAGSNSRVAECVVSNNAINGIETLSGSKISECVASGNVVGVLVQSYCVVSDCCVSNPAVSQAVGFHGAPSTTGVTLINCSVSGSGRGFWFQGGRMTLSQCSASRLTSNQNAFEVGQYSLLVECRSENNIGTGFSLLSHCRLENCISIQNTGDGFASPSSINVAYIKCTAASNSNGFNAGDGATVRDCTANTNAGRGIAMSNGGMVAGCVTRNNGSHGIEVNFSCTVRDNNSNGDGTNAAAGIHVLGQANRLEGNNISYANVGMLIDSGGNIVVRNTCKGSAQNYFIAAGNSVAPIVSATTNTGVIMGDTYAGSLGTTDPNANFTY